MEGFDKLAEIVRSGGVVALSGAGLSTESGIPDYRGPTGRARQAQPRPAQPMTYQTFIGSPAARQRYWARSHVGWRHVATAAPNAGHRAVTELQHRDLLKFMITQNVDGLLQRAGASDVVELHGSLHRVRCLGCAQRTPRAELNRRLAEANVAWAASDGASINPDGDAALSDEDVAAFRVVGCEACGGILKPDVVFFGENVPPDRVAACYEAVSAARALLVLGSSLTVLSGLRFVRHAAGLGIPVVIVNQGATRGDDLADVVLDAPLGTTLTALVSGARYTGQSPA
jgi:NAD-dependent SIR2 family protein deacetylase